VTTAATSTETIANPAAPQTVADAVRGWYLYGITRRGSLAAVLADADAGLPADAVLTAPAGSAPLQLLECGGLAAIVRPVLRADFSLAAVEERLRSADLEVLVRSHNQVIEAIHDRQAILPAKFGMVYADASDIVSALRSACDVLLTQLNRLEGCDEWAVHLYANREVVRERVSSRIPVVRRLREEFAAARPGRAYFIERQLRDELEAATRQVLVTLAQGAFDRLASSVIAGQVNPVRPATNAAGEVEILRAAFLVSREGAEQFEADVRAAADASEGLRCERSGPWPPYSFAMLGEMETT
jgi:hypothetical protein